MASIQSDPPPYEQQQPELPYEQPLCEQQQSVLPPYEQQHSVPPPYEQQQSGIQQPVIQQPVIQQYEAPPDYSVSQQVISAQPSSQPREQLQLNEYRPLQVLVCMCLHNECTKTQLESGVLKQSLFCTIMELNFANLLKGKRPCEVSTEEISETLSLRNFPCSIFCSLCSAVCCMSLTVVGIIPQIVNLIYAVCIQPCCCCFCRETESGLADQFPECWNYKIYGFNFLNCCERL